MALQQNIQKTLIISLIWNQYARLSSIVTFSILYILSILFFSLSFAFLSFPFLTLSTYIFLPVCLPVSLSLSLFVFLSLWHFLYSNVNIFKLQNSLSVLLCILKKKNSRYHIWISLFLLDTTIISSTYCHPWVEVMIFFGVKDIPCRVYKEVLLRRFKPLFLYISECFLTRCIVIDCNWSDCIFFICSVPFVDKTRRGLTLNANFHHQIQFDNEL